MDHEKIWSLSTAVIHPAMGQGDAENFTKHCDALYDYFNDNLDDIARDDRLGYHVGSAFYFMGMGMKDKNSNKYKFSMLASFLNLYAALPYQDMQACMAAHRLFILLYANTSFFDWRLATSTQLNQTHIIKSNEGNEKIKECKILAYNYLSQYLMGNGSVACSLLNYKEQTYFNKAFEAISGMINTDSDSIKKGQKVLEYIKEELMSAINGIRFLGMIV